MDTTCLNIIIKIHGVDCYYYGFLLNAKVHFEKFLNGEPLSVHQISLIPGGFKVCTDSVILSKKMAGEIEYHFFEPNKGTLDPFQIREIMQNLAASEMKKKEQRRENKLPLSSLESLKDVIYQDALKSEESTEAFTNVKGMNTLLTFKEQLPQRGLTDRYFLCNFTNNPKVFNRSDVNSLLDTGTISDKAAFISEILISVDCAFKFIPHSGSLILPKDTLIRSNTLFPIREEFDIDINTIVREHLSSLNGEGVTYTKYDFKLECTSPSC